MRDRGMGDVLPLAEPAINTASGHSCTAKRNVDLYLLIRSPDVSVCLHRVCACTVAVRLEVSRSTALLPVWSSEIQCRILRSGRIGAIAKIRSVTGGIG